MGENRDFYGTTIVLFDLSKEGCSYRVEDRRGPPVLLFFVRRLNNSLASYGMFA